ncbi:uncharacterized protein LOC128551947, partial [Mercenaria mercenaria]|uniref:uncharacterized protein LOC128551947 n=1 Tax=Mercenaria mercenaria TaxID=6596 RepID=UPI00234F74FB
NNNPRNSGQARIYLYGKHTSPYTLSIKMKVSNSLLEISRKAFTGYPEYYTCQNHIPAVTYGQVYLGPQPGQYPSKQFETDQRSPKGREFSKVVKYLRFTSIQTSCGCWFLILSGLMDDIPQVDLCIQGAVVNTALQICCITSPASVK